MKKFFLKLVILLVVVIVFQVIISSRNNYIPKNILKLNKALSNHADIIYFGDSVVFWSPPEEGGNTIIGDLLQDLMPNLKIETIYHAAYHMDIYLKFCEYIINDEHRPKIIILPINIRSFSPQWDMNPGFQFEKEKIFLSHRNYLFRSFYKPLSIFKMFSPEVTQRDYENTPVFEGDILIGRVKDFSNPEYNIWSEEKMKGIIKFSYLYPLSVEHRKIKSMLMIARLLKKNNIEAVFYIVPVDYQSAEEYLGRRFYEEIAKKTTLIKSVLAKEGIDVLDLSFKIEKGLFYWKDYKYINEHLVREGKKFVAEQLYQKITQDLRPKNALKDLRNALGR